MIEPLTTCVVDTGNANIVAENTTADEFKSAANPLIGSSLNIFPPIVLMILCPPNATPNAIAAAHNTFTNVGTSNSEMNPPENSANVIIPIDF